MRRRSAALLLTAGALALPLGDATTAATAASVRATPTVDFDADGVADGYELVNAWDLHAWLGRPDGGRDPIPLGDDPDVGDAPRTVERRMPDGRTEVLLVDTAFSRSRLTLLTDRGLDRLALETATAPARSYGSLVEAHWADVDHDGWADITATAYPCSFAAYDLNGCDQSTFSYLHRRAHGMELAGRLRVRHQELAPGERLRVRLRLASSGSRPPTGTVTFTAGGALLGGTYAVHRGRVDPTLPVPPRGDSTVTAHYSGDARHPAVDSQPVLVTAYVATTTRLRGTDAPTRAGEAWTGTFEVLGVSPDDAPWGDLRLVLDGVDRGTVPVSDGTAAFSIDGVAPGRHRLAATYLGNHVQAYASSSTTVRHRVLP